MELNNVTSQMAAARSSMSHEEFERAAMHLGTHRNEIREAFQARTATRVRVMVERIGSGQVLSEEDLELVRHWIIGDADSYLRVENNLEDWTAEYERLEKVIRSYEDRPLEDGDLLELKGLLEDAVRVAHDIANHLDKTERVDRFEAMIADQSKWSREERQRLARLLMGKLESPNR